MSTGFFPRQRWFLPTLTSRLVKKIFSPHDLFSFRGAEYWASLSTMVGFFFDSSFHLCAPSAPSKWRHSESLQPIYYFESGNVVSDCKKYYHNSRTFFSIGGTCNVVYGSCSMHVVQTAQSLFSRLKRITKFPNVQWKISRRRHFSLSINFTEFINFLEASHLFNKKHSFAVLWCYLCLTLSLHYNCIFKIL